MQREVDEMNTKQNENELQYSKYYQPDKQRTTKNASRSSTEQSRVKLLEAMRQLRRGERAPRLQGE